MATSNRNPYFTMEDAQLLMRIAECNRDGHQLRQDSVYTSQSPDPVQTHVCCDNCGAHAQLILPTPPQGVILDVEVNPS